MNNPKVSIIIPVYNVEKYLEECLDSIISQTLQDIEIICINDGSTDNSLTILQKYAQKDFRITIIDKQNEGVSAARNDGINAAKGEYITFVDGDDYLKLNACEDIYNHIKNNKPDICVYGNMLFNNNKTKNEPTLLNTLKELQYNDNFSLSELILKLGDQVTNHWYKRDFLHKNKLKFPLGLVVSEDGIFNIKCFLKNPTVKLISESYYIYRYFREGSTTTSSISLDRVLEQKRYCDRSDFYIQIPKEQKMIVDLKIVKSLIYRYSLLNNQKKPENLKYLCDYKKYLNENYNEDLLLDYIEYKNLSKLINQEIINNKNNLIKEKDEAIKSKENVIKNKNIEIQTLKQQMSDLSRKLKKKKRKYKRYKRISILLMVVLVLYFLANIVIR